VAYKYLTDRWEQTLDTARPPKRGGGSNVLYEIFRAYSGYGRFYHNLEHLQYCFETLDGEMAKFPGVGSIELALWYHDIIYDPKAKDNEEQSADLAIGHFRSRLGFPHEFALQVANLILATKHVNEPKTREAKVLLDVDLAILSASPEQFEAYELGIRREYEWVPEERFREGRAKILQGFLDRTWVYYTPEFREGPRESLARENLSRSLSRL